METTAALTWRKIGEQARKLTRNLGWRVAAGYLRNRGVPFDVACWVLFGQAPRM